MSKRTVLAIAVAAVMAVGIAGCSQSGGSDADATSTPIPTQDVTLLITGTTSGTYAPIVCGITDGVFARHGINLTLENSSGSATAGQAVVAGQAKFAITDYTTMLTLLAAGDKIQSVMTYYAKPTQGIFVLKDSGITSIKDLKGKNVGGASAGATIKLLPAVLQKYGLTMDDITFTGVESSSTVPALVVSKQVDAGIGAFPTMFPPMNSQAPTKAFLFADEGIDYLNSAIVASPDTVKNEPDLVKGLVQGMQDAWISSLKDADNCVKEAYVGPEQGTEADLLEGFKAATAFIATDATLGHPMGYTPPEELQATLDLNTKYLGLKDGDTIDLDSAYTNDFLDPDLVLPKDYDLYD